MHNAQGKPRTPLVPAVVIVLLLAAMGAGGPETAPSQTERPAASTPDDLVEASLEEDRESLDELVSLEELLSRADEVMHEPSVTKRFGTSWAWLYSLSTEVWGSRPIRAVPISWMPSPGVYGAL